MKLLPGTALDLENERLTLVWWHSSDPEFDEERDFRVLVISKDTRTDWAYWSDECGVHVETPITEPYKFIENLAFKYNISTREALALHATELMVTTSGVARYAGIDDELVDAAEAVEELWVDDLDDPDLQLPIPSWIFETEEPKVASAKHQRWAKESARIFMSRFSDETHERDWS